MYYNAFTNLLKGPTYDDEENDNEIAAFRAKAFWRLLGKIRAKTPHTINECQWISLNKNSNIKRSAAAGKRKEDGENAWDMGKGLIPIICPHHTGKTKCKIEHNPRQLPFCGFMHKDEEDFARYHL